MIGFEKHRCGSLLGALLILSLWGVFLYLSSFFVPFQWDDIPNIVKNPALFDWKDLPRIFRFWPSRVLLFWTLALNYHLGGLKIFGYHLFNLSLHVLCAFLVYLIGRELFRSAPGLPPGASGQQRTREALFAALIFLVHPLQTQSVTNVIQRGGVLSGFCCLLSFWLYILCRRLGSRVAWAGAWVVGLLGMYSKEGAVALPLLLLIWEWVGGPRQSLAERLKAWLPFLLLPVVLFVTIRLAPRAGEANLYYRINLGWQQPVVRLVDSPTPVSSRAVYLFTQLNALRAYLRLLIVPVRQSIYHNFPVTPSFFQGTTAVSAAVILALLIIACRLRGPRPAVALGIAFFFVALLPTSSVFVLVPLLAENHLYLPLAGYAWAFSNLWWQAQRPPGFRWQGLGGGLILAGLSLLSIQRNQLWVKPISVWQDALDQAPDLASLHLCLAGCNIREGKYREAIDECETALRLNLDLRARSALGDAYFQNLWSAHYSSKDYPAAERTARRWLETYPLKSPARFALAITLLDQGRQEEAKQELLTAAALEPVEGPVYFYLGKICGERREYAEAEGFFQKALEREAEKPPVYNELGRLYEKWGRPGDAEAAYRRALALDPGYVIARFNLGRLYWRLKKYSLARQEMVRLRGQIDDPAVAQAITGYIQELERDAGERPAQ